MQGKNQGRKKGEQHAQALTSGPRTRDRERAGAGWSTEVWPGGWATRTEKRKWARRFGPKQKEDFKYLFELQKRKQIKRLLENRI